MLINTEAGLELEIRESAFDDMEALDALVALDDGNPLAISKVCDYIMDKNEKKKLYDFYRSEDGKVHVKTFIDVLTEIMKSLGKKEKN